MKLWDIVKTVGAGVIANVVPGGNAIVSIINEILPDDNKLPETATGNECIAAIQTLPDEQRATLISKQFDVDITQIEQSHETIRAMLDSDAKNPQTTRPYIAKHSFHIIAFASIISILMWAYAILNDKNDMVETVTDGWPFIVSVIAPLVTLLMAYFGVIKVESKNRLDAANGVSNPNGLVGAITGLIKRGK